MVEPTVRFRLYKLMAHSDATTIGIIPVVVSLHDIFFNHLGSQKGLDVEPGLGYQNLLADIIIQSLVHRFLDHLLTVLRLTILSVQYLVVSSIRLDSVSPWEALIHRFHPRV